MAEPRQAQFGMRLPIENEACRVWPATRLQGPDLVASTEADRFQIIVGLDDLPQPILRGAVATIGVGMMPLHKRLEPRFDVLRGGVGLEPERVERFAFGIAHRAGFCRAAPGRAPWNTCCAELPENPEWITDVSEFGIKPGGVGARTGRPATHPHFPGRAMAYDGFLLITGNILGAHPGEEIVGMIVFAHVFQTKPPIFPLSQPPLGGAVGRGRGAIRPFAGWALPAQPTVFVGLDPDAIEQGRVAFHDRSVCACGRDIFKS